MPLVVVMALMRVSKAVIMAMSMIVMPAAEEPGARDVYRQTKTGDRDRLGEMNRNRFENTADGFIADQDRDHRQHDGAGEAGEVAEFTGAEREGGIVGVLARVGLGERGQQ